MTKVEQEVQKPEDSKGDVEKKVENSAETPKEENKEVKEGEEKPEGEEKKEQPGEKKEEKAEDKKEQVDPDKVLLEKATAYFPDQEFKDPAEAKTALIAKIEENEKYVADSRAANARLLEVFDANMELSEIVRDVADGVPFLVALAKQVDPATLMLKEGDEGYEQFKKANEDRLQRVADEKKARKEYENNLTNSFKSFDEFVTEKKMDDEQGKFFVDQVNKVLHGLVTGNVSKEFLEVIYKGVNYDKDIKAETEIAEIRGKNAKIQEEVSKTKGDGVPEVKRQSEPVLKPKEPERKKTSIDRAVEEHERRDVFKTKTT